MPRMEKIVIKSASKPSKESIDNLSEWFCEVFDLSNKESGIEPAILRKLLESTINGEGVTSKELNKNLDVPRSTIIYHLNRFIYSGLAVRQGREYYLRSQDFASTLEDLEADMLREFKRMESFAEKLDQIMQSDLNGRRKERKQR